MAAAKKNVLVPVILLVVAGLVAFGAFNSWRAQQQRRQAVGTWGGDQETSTKQKDWCNAGAYVNMGSIKSRVLGMEKQMINGKSVDVCCGDVITTGEGDQGLKSCYSQDDKYTISWQKGEGGKVFKFTEGYPDGEKSCSRMFDETGTSIYEGCQ